MRVQDTSLIALLPALAYANALDLAQVSSTTTALTSSTAVDPARSSGIDAASITTGAGLPASNYNAVQSEIAPGATATILLGEGSKFFSPDTISKAAPGAVIEFRVDGQGERSVASGKFAAPCNNDPSGFYSGKLISSGDDVFQYTVVNGEPVWFFSGIGEQCRQGAVGVINPSAQENLEAYRAQASRNTNGTTIPMAVLRGGVAGKGKIDKIEKTDDKDVTKEDDNKTSDAGNTTKDTVGLPAGKDKTITTTKTVFGAAKPTNAFKPNSSGTEEPSGALSSQGMLNWTSMVGAGVLAVAMGFGAFM